MNGTIRLDEVGSVARAWLPEVVEHSVRPLAVMIHQGTLPQLALAGPVISALSQGTSDRRSRAALADVGPIISALIALLVLDARTVAANIDVHNALRALLPVSLDAVEDLLAPSSGVSNLVEAERMFRAGLLAHDWILRAVPCGGVAVILAPLRKGVEA